MNNNDIGRFLDVFVPFVVWVIYYEFLPTMAVTTFSVVYVVMAVFELSKPHNTKYKTFAALFVAFMRMFNLKMFVGV